MNGEGIYGTRPFSIHNDSTIAFTQSKDNQYVYAVIKEWPGKELYLKSLKPIPGSKIEMLGYNQPLEWMNSLEGTTIKFPVQLQSEKNRPCRNAWILKISQNIKY